MGNPLRGSLSTGYTIKTVGKLTLMYGTNWRTNVKSLFVRFEGSTNPQNYAELTFGALGNPVVSFNTGATREFRDEVHKHLSKLETLLILKG